MSLQTRKKNVLRSLGVLAAASALTLGLSGTAQAVPGWWIGWTSDAECGSARGLYGYWKDGTAQGKPFYDTEWDFDVHSYCANTSVSLYTKYKKWTGSKWVDYTRSYHRISAAGSGNNVADVRLYVCKVGVASSCGLIRPE
ncbi:hypothetical protein G5C51_05520 [Streptomyces sp. A7024]|uniref:Secreted protein n=1 Tax=Streptomyces coryli TaxID=1128680 RepID=A0A6G4TV99_9ACTN|nr:hypothetical protein [Streptomyces coryli]NGN63366.1 hypothetical protein [Streptomyces coryli]